MGTLADIVEKSVHVKPPALIVVGDVVSLADKLQWFTPVFYNHPIHECDIAARPAGT
jgi:hypothetical protein